MVGFVYTRIYASVERGALIVAKRVVVPRLKAKLQAVYNL